MRIKQLLPYVGTAFVAGVAGVVIGSSTATATVETVAAPAPPPVTITKTVPVPVPAPANALPTDEEVQDADTRPREGTLLVGDEVAPGTYKGRPSGSQSCYWARLGSLDGGDIIDNDFTKGATVVKIAPSDTAFTSRGCTWDPAE